MGEQPAMGIDRQLAGGGGIDLADEITGLAFLAKAEIFHLHQAADGEAIVDLGKIYILDADPGLAERAFDRHAGTRHFQQLLLLRENVIARDRLGGKSNRKSTRLTSSH